jgi:hypothetical protein
LGDEADDDGTREIEAGGGFDGIAAQGPAAELRGEAQLRPRERVHRQHGNQGDDQTRQQEQDPGRDQLDDAVDAEGEQAETMRRNARAGRDDALDRHPADGQPFEPERLPDQTPSIGVGNPIGSHSAP